MTMNSGQPRWRAAVTVLPKTGVNDPEGEAILGGLHQLGYDGVSRVRAGRLFHVFLDAADATAAREQATGLQEVNTAVNSMDQMTQQNAAMVEETTAASQTLAQESHELKLLLQRFRLGQPQRREVYGRAA